VQRLVQQDRSRQNRHSGKVARERRMIVGDHQ
jgi:hypothetical protein